MNVYPSIIFDLIAIGPESDGVCQANKYRWVNYEWCRDFIENRSDEFDFVYMYPVAYYHDRYSDPLYLFGYVPEEHTGD